MDLSSHRDTRGCVLDFTRWKPDDRVDIALGYVCDSDSEHIRLKVGDEYLNQMQLVISRKWIGTVNDNGSVAFDLKQMFRFDIERDSGFNKTYWERARAKFDEAPYEIVKILVQAIIAVLLAAILVSLKLKT